MQNSEDEQKLQRIKSSLKSYPDFPKKGIIFQDVFSILANPQLTKDLLEMLASKVQSFCPEVDVIVGLEARGFLFGLPLAAQSLKPFVPIRKKGKLPGETEKVSFKLEYGEDVFEMQKGVINPGDIVIVVDDLLATGGTLKAANDLIAKSGARVGLNLVCFELSELKGRQKVKTPVHALLQL